MLLNSRRDGEHTTYPQTKFPAICKICSTISMWDVDRNQHDVCVDRLIESTDYRN